MADIVFNPSVGQHDAEALPPPGLGSLESWTCKASSEEGDLNLLWFGDPTYEIVALGVFRGEVQPEDNSDGRYDWTEADTVYFGDFKPLVVLDHRIGIQELKTDPELSGWWNTKPYRGLPKTMLKHPRAIRRLLKLIASRNPVARDLCRKFSDGLKGGAKPSATASRFNKAVKPQQLAKALSELSEDEAERALTYVKRIARERALRKKVLHQWGASCAACGRVLRRESLYECEVAHVMPVQEKGPDSVGNALPLCRTHHWAFDNHLWAIRADCSISVATPNGGSEEEHKAWKTLHRELDGKKLRHGLGQVPARRLLGSRYLQHRWRSFLAANSSD